MFFLARQIETSPGFIVRPISNLFGHIVSFLFDIVYALGASHSLGFTIILMTIIFRACMLPLSIKAQRSMMRMRLIKPELDKIQAKYGSTKDPEIIKKMNMEKQVLMQKHDANPLKGCFPMLLQMPLFIGLNFIMRQAFMYVVQLRNLYSELAMAIQRVPEYFNIFVPPGLTIAEHRNLPAEYANAIRLLPQSILDNNIEMARLRDLGYSTEAIAERVGETIDISVAADFARVINRFTTENWLWLQEQIPEYYWAAIAELNSRRHAIETFFSISMVEPSGLSFPQILLPLLTALTMVCSSYLMQQRTADPNADDKVKMQQKIMLVVMPVVMFFITIGLPAGVALFWVTGQVFQVCTDLVLNKKDGIPLKLPFVNKRED